MDKKVKLKKIKSDEWYGQQEGLELEVTQNKKDPESWFVTSGQYAGNLLPKKYCAGYVSPDSSLEILFEEYVELVTPTSSPITRTRKDGKTILSFGEFQISANDQLSKDDLNFIASFAEKAYMLAIERGKEALEHLIENKKE